MGRTLLLMYYGHLESNHKCPDSQGQLVYTTNRTTAMYMQVWGLSRCPYSQVFWLILQCNNYCRLCYEMTLKYSNVIVSPL